ncbi:LytR family transcriptional regulator [Bacillus sp. 31A1R]|uniref:Polyisoprenyl-teichoic acid--peptidoglycan teichoic acid transferase TagU n=1 Tax=Robertmurraya mangrovi TaxID=3098077 RepID=A0ABU5IXP2_9BACI|nr:LytR family transcriptional regulator [Bacillus sp. 31A1R]MDZ5471911.1 LytR family transcriptional regulator [Bacillus sp. 31A1R]
MSKKKRWLYIMGASFLLVIFGIGAYGFSLYHSVSKTVETMHHPVKHKSTKRMEEVELVKRDPFSVLLLGVDEREGDKGRSDTMIVLTVNPNQNSVKMLSIPRDTRTAIIGHGTTDKINHAYAFGGEAMSMATVENLLDIPIDYFIKINMLGFKDIIDSLDGITVHSAFAFSEGGHHFKEGENHLNGNQALAYVRMRKQDPQGDFGRQLRQRQIIQGIVKKGVSISSITKIDDVLKVLGANVKTNLQLDQMLDIQKNYRDAGKNIKQLHFTAQGQLINNIYYEIISDEELQSVQSELKSHIEVQ